MKNNQMYNDGMRDLEETIKEEVEIINQKLYRRWYDDDPVISSVMKKIEYSPNDVKEKISMQIIKIIIGLNISEFKYTNIEEMMRALKQGYDETRRNRWYDYNATVRTAISLLQQCKPHSRRLVSQEIKKYLMILEQLPL